MSKLWTVLVILSASLPLATGCVVEQEGPRGISNVPIDDLADLEEEDDVLDGACEEGEVRGCKIQINENNCFVGEQVCEDGSWSDCLEPGDIDNG